MFELVEGTGRFDWNFKTIVAFETFAEFLDRAKEEANYWTGYGPYLEKKIRESGQYDWLDEGLELVKRAANLRQAIYSDAKLLKGLAAKYPNFDEFQAETRKLENRIVIKAFDVARLREEFLYYLMNTGIEPRTKYSKKLKAEDE